MSHQARNEYSDATGRAQRKPPKSEQGTAMTEAVISLPLLLLLLQGTLYFGDLCAAWQETEAAARYVSWHMLRPQETWVSGSLAEARRTTLYPAVTGVRSRWTNNQAGSSALRYTRRTIRAAATKPLTSGMTGIANGICTSELGCTGLQQIDVVAEYQGEPAFGGPVTLQASHVLPGSITITKEDVPEEPLYPRTLSELGAYITQWMPL